MRDQEMKRNQSLEQVMEHTAALIANMAGVMETTDRSLKTTLKLQAKFDSDTHRKRKALQTLVEIARSFLNRASFNKSSFRQEIHVAYNQARFHAQDLPAKRYPAEYVVMFALYTGTVVGRSQDALDILDSELQRRHDGVDERLLSRSLYFRGHFAIRLGQFSRAQAYFQNGETIAPEKDAYTLFALVSRLYALREQPSVSPIEREDIEKAIRHFWDRKQNSPLSAGKLDPKTFREILGHTYAALLVEGLRADEVLPVSASRAEVQVIRDRILAGLEVATEANRRFNIATGSDSGSFDAVRYEAGLRLAKLGDSSSLMTIDQLIQAVKKCRSQRNSGDIREKIVYTTRLARFYGRLSIEYERKDQHQQARDAESYMEAAKQSALDLLSEFQADWDSREKLFSVFLNSYCEPQAIVRDIEQDIVIDNCRKRRADADSVITIN